MKNIKLFCFGLILLVFSVGESHAILLDFDPSSQTASLGDTVSVDVNISGLGNFSSPSLGTFDLDITFNSTVLSYNGTTFGSLLGDPALFEAITSDSLIAPGTTVNIFELSFLEENSTTCFFCVPPYLEGLQPASFTLASLSFDVVAVGTSALGISINALGDASGSSLMAITSDGSVSAGPVSTVPEPGTLLLFSAGLVGLARVRRKFKGMGSCGRFL